MSPTELPIACSLDSNGFEQREADLRALGRRSLIGSERGPSGAATLRFKPDDPTRADLERIVAAESECCRFLELTVRESEVLELTIAGPDGARPVVDDLVAALSGEST